MADEAKGRASTRSLTWLWMILALVVVGGFLAWLGAASEPTAVAIVEEEEEAPEEAVESGVEVVAKDTLAADKSRFAGQRIQVEQVELTTQLGDRIFWGELGDRQRQVPILVRIDSAAVRSGTSSNATW